MDLDEFSRQLESMHARFMQLRPTDGARARRPAVDVGGDVRGARGDGGGDAGRRGGAAPAERRAGGVAAGGRGGAAAVSGPVRLRAGRLPGDGPGRDDPGGESGGRRAAGGLAVATWRASRWPTYVAMDDRAGVPGGPAPPAAGRPARGLDRPDPAAAGRSLRRGDHGGRGPRLGRGAVELAVDVPRGRGRDRGESRRGLATARAGDDRADGRRCRRTSWRASAGAASAPRTRPRRCAGCLQRHRPDRLGGRRARPAGTGSSAPGSSSCLGYPVSRLARRAGVLGRDHPRRRSIDGRGASGAAASARAGPASWNIAWSPPTAASSGSASR